MRITIFGAGYVGLVTAACFAELGNNVLCVDTNEAKVAKLSAGECPIHEPGLTELLTNNIQANRLHFTTDAKMGVEHGLYIFIAVGTPSDEHGAANLEYVFSAAKSIGQHIDGYRIVINKSTVPVGTADKVQAIIASALEKRGVTVEFDVASNPEFLREGAAVGDFMACDRIIVGTPEYPVSSKQRGVAAEHLKALYAPFNRNQDRLICMDVRSAELTKYAANAFLATKISFINEMSNLAERLGADIEQVRIGIGSDPRIGLHFINPGCGYGGSCFPKDVSALSHLASQTGFDAQLINAVHDTNERQKLVLFDKINTYFKGNLKGKCIALWGLAFKPNTDDMRDASSRTLMEKLWAAGATVRAYDPVANVEAHRLYGDRTDLKLCENPLETLENADALAVVTEWKVFSSPDFTSIKQLLRYPAIFDGRNLYDPQYLAKLGFDYHAIGRGLNHLKTNEKLSTVA